MNPVAMILNALKVWPEPYELELEEADLMQLAELDSRLGEIRQVIAALKKQVQADLAVKLDGKTLRYGDSLFRGVPLRGSVRVGPEELWWEDVVEGLKATAQPEALLKALFPATSVRLTALPKLASVLGVDHDVLRDKYVTFAESGNPLTVLPMSKAPQYLANLEDGELR